jgi:hypothetical protein
MTITARCPGECPRGIRHAAGSGSRLEKVARCRACRVVYVWRGPVSVRDAVCLRCGQRLRRTTYLCRDPRVELSEAPPARGWLT